MIFRSKLIAGGEVEGLGLALGNEGPVERVAVDWRKGQRPGGVRVGEGEFIDAINAKEFRKIVREFEFPFGSFQAEFPN